MLSGAGKVCLVHGLKQLLRDVESDVRTQYFRSDVTTKNTVGRSEKVFMRNKI